MIFLYKVPEWEYKGSWPDQNLEVFLGNATADPIELEILKNVGNMSNHILANAASKQLTKFVLRLCIVKKQGPFDINFLFFED